MKTKTFNIADLHGRYDLLEKAIEQIEAYPDVEKGVVVFTGDYIDRGLQSKQVIARLLKGPNDTSKWTWVCLKGNHETFLEQYYFENKLINDDFWCAYNGGKQTLASYDDEGMSYMERLQNPKLLIPKAHAEFIRDMPYYYKDKARVFVHAKVDPETRLEDQDKREMVWDLYPQGGSGGWWDDDSAGWKTVVHGHEQDENNPSHFYLRYNYDTFAWYTGKLVVGVWDDNGTDPIDNIKIRLRSHVEKQLDDERWMY